MPKTRPHAGTLRRCRRVGPRLVGLSTLLLVVVSVSSGSSGQEQRPNMLLIMADIVFVNTMA